VKEEELLYLPFWIGAWVIRSSLPFKGRVRVGMGCPDRR